MSDCRTCEYDRDLCYCPPGRDCTAYKRKGTLRVKHTFEFEAGSDWIPGELGCWYGCPFSFNIKNGGMCKCHEKGNRTKCPFVGNLDKDEKRYDIHEVAKIIADLVHTNCACDYDEIAEWLSDKCDINDSDINVDSILCWEQYLKHLNDVV